MDKKEQTDMLLHEVENKTKDISVKSISLPFGELANMYKKDLLVIQPKFQRFYRWDKNQKTNFIESILLWLPIPPIFVSKRWKKRELVDGLQRLSTIFEYFWILEWVNVAKDKQLKNWLNWTEYLPSLEGLKFEEMPSDLQFDLERNYRVDIIILNDKTEKKDAKYELFYRLNTWWSTLSNQEVRSAIIIMENEVLYDSLDKLRNQEYFIDSLYLSDKDNERQFDLELILRFFAIKNYSDKDKKIRSVKEFLDRFVNKLINNFDIQKESKIFNEVFYFISNNFSSSPFRKYITANNVFKWRTNISSYDIIWAWLGYAIEHGHVDLKIDREFIIEQIKKLSNNPEFLDGTKVWVTSEGKMIFSIKFWRKYFNKSH